MNDQLFNSTVQSLVRAGLMAAAGALAIEVREGDLNTTVGVVTSVLLAAISVGWSAFNHKTNIQAPPPPPSKGGGFLGLILAFLMAGIMLGGTVTMTGCKGGGITAAQVTEYRTQADAAETELEATIAAARAEGNLEAADKAQAILDKFRAERAKWESKIKTDEQGNVDIESSIASAAMVAAPPGVGAAILVGLALFKRFRSAASTPPAVPPTT
jgi:hypothetical protein